MILNLQPFTLMTGKTDHNTIKDSCWVWGHSTLTHANGPPDVGMKCNAQISRSRQQSYDFPSEQFHPQPPKKESLEQRMVKINQASLIDECSANLTRERLRIYANFLRHRKALKIRIRPTCLPAETKASLTFIHNL